MELKRCFAYSADLSGNHIDTVPIPYSQFLIHLCWFAPLKFRIADNGGYEFEQLVFGYWNYLPGGTHFDSRPSNTTPLFPVRLPNTPKPMPRIAPALGCGPDLPIERNKPNGGTVHFSGRKQIDRTPGGIPQRCFLVWPPVAIHGAGSAIPNTSCRVSMMGK